MEKITKGIYMRELLEEAVYCEDVDIEGLSKSEMGGRVICCFFKIR